MLEWKKKNTRAEILIFVREKVKSSKRKGNDADNRSMSWRQYNGSEQHNFEIGKGKQIEIQKNRQLVKYIGRI